METKKINDMTVLTASEGMMLRNGDSFSETVVLGKYDKAENYTEVSRDEYDAYMKEQSAENADEGDSQGADETAEPPSVVPTLSDAIASKISEISAYDRSAAVNSFTLGGVEMWLNFDERARIRQSIDAYRNEGRTEMTKWFNGKAFTFPLDTWQTMLDKLSVYASEALNVTERHKAEVSALMSIEAVEGYDYKSGYPEKLSFTTTSDAAI